MFMHVCSAIQPHRELQEIFVVVVG